MWPIYLVIAEYAVTYFVLASAAYVCISVVAGHNKLGKRLFFAVLAFGGCSLLGYIILNVLTVFLDAKSGSVEEPNRLIVFAVYVIPGMIGSWISWKTFKPST